MSSGCAPFQEGVSAFLDALAISWDDVARDELLVYPPDGAMGLTGPLDVLVGLDGAHEGQLPVVQVFGETVDAVGDCALDESGRVARCAVLDAVPRGEDLTIEVTVGDLVHTAAVSGRVPAPGRAWLLSDGLALRQLGTGGATDFIGDALSGSPLVGLLVEDDDGAVLLAGPAALYADGSVGLDAPGLVLVAPLGLVDGRMASEPATIFLPARPGGVPTPVTVFDAVVVADATADGLWWRIEGAVPAESIIAVAESAGAQEDLAVAAVGLDEDLDADERLDACSFEVGGLAPEVQLRAWEVPTPSAAGRWGPR